MPLIQIVITLVIVGVLMWLINHFIPMQSSIRSVLNGLVTIVLVVWLMNAFGLMHYITHFHAGH